MQLTPEQINDFIAKSVMDSHIGVEVQKAVKKAVDALATSYQNPFDSIVKSHVSDEIQKVIKEQYKDLITQRVEQAIKTQITEEVIDRIVDAAFQKLKNNY